MQTTCCHLSLGSSAAHDHPQHAPSQHCAPAAACCPCPADNVGDNVGDIAGMGADLFGSFAESTCAALVVAGVSELGANHNWPAMMFPLMVSATGILVCILTTLIATDLKPARHISEIEHTLKMQLIISTVLMTPVSATPGCCCVGWLSRS